MSRKATDPPFFNRIVERNAGAGYRLVELAEDEDAALRDDWGTDGAVVRIQRGRVGLESLASNHIPEVQLTAYLAEPPPVEHTAMFEMQTIGTWPVRFKTREVQVWSGDSYPGDELPMELPNPRAADTSCASPWVVATRANSVSRTTPSSITRSTAKHPSVWSASSSTSGPQGGNCESASRPGLE